ncbi:MAG: hypothetical protein ACRCU0_05215 [Candidatus Rhabdochlamydia sp.]
MRAFYKAYEKVQQAVAQLAGAAACLLSGLKMTCIKEKKKQSLASR